MAEKRRSPFFGEWYRLSQRFRDLEKTRDDPQSWRRVLALHRELSRRTGGNTYFLSCRDAAKVFPGLTHQTAYNINLALERLGVIKIVRVGDAHPNGKASQFRYLLPLNESDAEEDEGFEL